MEVKNKPCKGTGLAKGYGCNKGVFKRTYGLCSSCYYDWLVNSENGKIKLKKSLISAELKTKKIEKQKENIEVKKMRDNVTNWKKRLQDQVQLIARLIDYGLPCLARNINGQMHGGHVFSKGGHAEMRFNLHNIHRQSAYSNTFKSDDGLLREKLSDEYGEDYFNFVSSLRNLEVKKYSNIEYKNFYEKAVFETKKIKSDLKVRSISERIKLRNEINNSIGIYDAKSCEFNK